MGRIYIRLLLLGLFAAAIGPLSAAEGVVKGYVAVDGGRLYYEAAGAGEAVIFVHGHSLDRRMWREQTASFSDRYRVIVYDARGYGRSSKQREGFRFTHADDLLALMDALGIERAHLVGLSMGGFIVGDLVAMHPERLLSATMAEGVIRSTPSINEPMTEEEIAAKNEAIKAVKQSGVRRYKQEWYETLMRGGSRVERIARPLRQMLRSWDCWQPLHHEVHCYYAREAMAVLQRRQPSLPCLYISGHRPHKSRPKPPRMMQFTPNGRHVVIPDAGHLVNMEQPELFNQTVLDFLMENQIKN